LGIVKIKIKVRDTMIAMNKQMRAMTWMVAVGAALPMVFGATFAYGQQAEIEQSARLRTEIRSAILADSRSVELTEMEIDAMVEKLAGEAEKQGVSEDIAPPPPPPPLETFGAVSEGTSAVTTPWGQSVPMAALYGVVLVSLLIAFLLLKWIISMRHRHEEQDVEIVQTPSPSIAPPPPPTIQ